MYIRYLYIYIRYIYIHATSVVSHTSGSSPIKRLNEPQSRRLNTCWMNITHADQLTAARACTTTANRKTGAVTGDRKNQQQKQHHHSHQY